MEAEHYPNGVLESISTRIVNGAYKQEDLQTDESSMGQCCFFVWPSPCAPCNTHFFLRGAMMAGSGSLRN